MKKILCIGSGGFVFSNFIRKTLFSKSDYNFVGIDVCEGSNALNNVYANRGHKFYIGSAADERFLDLVFQIEKPDIVMYGAQTIDKHHQKHCEANILGVQNTVLACTKYQIEHLIYLSDDRVYSNSKEIAEEVDFPQPFDFPAITKFTGELLISQFTQHTILRLGNIFGPRQPSHNWIPKIIAGYLKQEPLLLEFPSLSIQEWTYIDDICFAFWKILETSPTNQTYNISAQQEFSLCEISNQICDFFEGSPDLIRFVESATPLPCYRLHNTKLKNLGWTPSWKFQTALQNTCTWYATNKWFLR